MGFVDFDINHDFNDTVEVSILISGLAAGAHSITVNTYGDLSSNTAANTMGVYQGDSPARDQVGLLGNGYMLTADSHGLARAFFTDPVIRLNGPDSVVGLSVVVYGTGTAAGASEAVAQCVIGIRGEDPLTMYPAIIQIPGVKSNVTVPQVNAAAATLSATAFGSSNTFGYVSFTALPNTNINAPSVMVRYLFTGLTPGNHAWSINSDGDVGASLTNPNNVPTGAETGSVFQGDCPLRSSASINAVGLINNGADLVADSNGRAWGWFLDNSLWLNGFDTITARSIVVYASNSSASNVVASGIIGRLRESYTQLDLDSPVASYFSCKIQPTQARYAVASQGGTARFASLAGSIIITPGPSGLTVSFNLTGLTPLGSHYLQLHQRGNLLAVDDGASAGVNFIGGPLGRGAGVVRPFCYPQQVAQLNNGAAIVASASGTAVGSFLDTQMSLTGFNSPMGRSIVLHGDGVFNPSVRIGWCTVGAVGRVDPGVTVCQQVPTPSPTPLATAGPSGCLSGFNLCTDGVCRPVSVGCPSASTSTDSLASSLR